MFEIGRVCYTCSTSRFRLAAPRRCSKATCVPQGSPRGQCGPRAVCSRGSSVAFCDSVESLSLVSALRLHPCSNSRLVQSARILVITLFGMEAIWAELKLGFVLCACSHSSRPALSPGVPAGRVSPRFHRCTGLGERTEAEKCKEFLCREAKALPGFRATHSSASAEELDAWGLGHE